MNEKCHQHVLKLKCVYELDTESVYVWLCSISVFVVMATIISCVSHITDCSYFC